MNMPCFWTYTEHIFFKPFFARRQLVSVSCGDRLSLQRSFGFRVWDGRRGSSAEQAQTKRESSTGQDQTPDRPARQARCQDLFKVEDSLPV